MTLQTKILLVTSFTFVALISVLYAASQAIVLGSFSQQEVQDATQNVLYAAGDFPGIHLSE